MPTMYSGLLSNPIEALKRGITNLDLILQELLDRWQKRHVAELIQHRSSA
jgi:hypothetical protein